MERIFSLDSINECSEFYTQHTNIEVETPIHQYFLEESESKDKTDAPEGQVSTSQYAESMVDLQCNETTPASGKYLDYDATAFSETDDNDFFTTGTAQDMQLVFFPEDSEQQVKSFNDINRISDICLIRKEVKRLLHIHGFLWEKISPLLADYDKEKAFKVYQQLKSKGKNIRYYRQGNLDIEDVSTTKELVEILSRQRLMLINCLQELNEIERKKCKDKKY